MELLNSRQYKSLINPRTIITIVIALLSCSLVLHYKIRLHEHLMLFSIIITFPLVFSLQSAFKRRDRALEFLSLYKAAIAVVYRSIARSKKLSPASRDEAKQMIMDITQILMDCLRSNTRQISEVFQSFEKIFLFMEKNKAELSGNASTRVIRYMRDVYEAGTYLVSLKRHRTIQVLRSFSFVVINLFPFIQAAILYDSLGNYYAPWVIYLTSVVTAGVLITMYNIQLQLEYPFDQVGLDDIHLEDFMFDPLDLPSDHEAVVQKKAKKQDRPLNASQPAMVMPLQSEAEEEDDE